MKAILTLVGIVIGLWIVIWAWPVITAVVLGGGAGLIGAAIEVFVAFVSWIVLAQLFGKTKADEISKTSQVRWFFFFLVLGFACGIASYNLSNGDFVSRYIPAMVIIGALLGCLPVVADRVAAKDTKVVLTSDGRIVRKKTEAMSD